MTSSKESVTLGITEWCSPCSAPYFPNSCAIYQHQCLGLHSDQMVEPASNPTANLIMVNFWLLGYVKEQANYVQTRSTSSMVPQ